MLKTTFKSGKAGEDHVTDNPLIREYGTVLQFASTTDYLRYIQNEDNFHKSWTENGEQRDSRTGSRSFTGTDSWGEAITLATDGWADGLKKLSSAMDVIHSDGRSLQRIFDVAGDLPCPGRFAAGVPDCMSRRVPSQSTRRPIVELVIDGSYNCGIKTNRVMNVGAAIASLIDQLENNGYRVGLTLSQCGTGRGKTLYGNIVQIKTPDQALDMQDMIFFIAHPSALRRLSFAAKESVYDEPGMPFGYGQPTPITIHPDDEQNTIYLKGLLNAANTIGKSPTQAMKAVLDRVREIRPDLIREDMAA